MLRAADTHTHKRARALLHAHTRILYAFVHRLVPIRTFRFFRSLLLPCHRFMWRVWTSEARTRRVRSMVWTVTSANGERVFLFSHIGLRFIRTSFLLVRLHVVVISCPFRAFVSIPEALVIMGQVREADTRAAVWCACRIRAGRAHYTY